MEASVSRMSVGCAVLTYQAESYIERCLAPLLRSPLKPKLLVVDSSSRDRTVEISRRHGVETLVIPQGEFNHGRTREMARKKLGTKIVCMFTQDAYMVDEHALTLLIKPLIEDKAVLSYARQLPHHGAGFFETFHRKFNYPEEGQLRSIGDVGHYGVHTFFCSNSCAAYLNSALDSIGGFDGVLLGEDTVAAAKLLHRGGKIAYVADAEVYHSHDYGLLDEFRRSFDTGLARKGYEDLIKLGGSDSKRGVEYVKAMFGSLVKEAPHLLPYGALQIVSKWVGYRLGRSSHRAPVWFKRAFSSQKYYWGR